MGADVTSPARRIFAGARNLIAFLLGLGIVSAALTAFVPFPLIGNLWRKHQHIAQKGDPYSLIYFGSSRVFHEFLPEQFDSEMAQYGQPTKSFNFGQDGMWPPESFYMVREVLKTPHKNLKWVFIDLMGMKTQIDGNEPTKRAVYWHDFQHTVMSWRHVLSQDMEGQRTWAEKAGRCWRHTLLWAQRDTSLGRGQEQLEFALRLAKDPKLEAIPDEGFEEGGTGPLTGEKLTEFTEAFTALRDHPPQPKPIDPLFRSALDDIVQVVRSAGAEPVFVVPSGLYGRERFTDWPPAGVKIMHFDDPERFPDLYNPEHRYDPHHLDMRGAKDFTRHLSEAFHAMLQQKP